MNTVISLMNATDAKAFWRRCSIQTAAIAIVAGYMVSRLVQKYIEFRVSPLRKLPGPPRKSFLLGHFVDILTQPFMTPHKKWIQQLSHDNGKVRSVPPLISYSFLLGRWTVMILDPDIVQDILTENASREPLRYPKRYGFLQQITGAGLVTLEGEQWSRHRRIFQPCFRASVLQERLETVVPPLVQRFVLAWERAAEQEKVVDAATHMAALVLDILGQVSFAHDFRGITTVENWVHSDANVDDDRLGEISDPLIQALNTSFKITPLKVVVEFLGLSSWINTLDPQSRKTRQILDEAAGKIVQNARDASTAAPDDSSSNFRDRMQSRSLLEQMLRSTNTEAGVEQNLSRNQLSEKELKEEIASFVVTGHETTATWCMWALYALALDPTLQQRVYDDVCKNWTQKDNGDLIGLEDVGKMDYFQAFLKEVLRLYAPVGMMFRYTTRQECWHGYTIPPDTRLCIPIHLLHRHADFWDRPEDFNPDRWLDGDNGACPKHKFSFLPFSDGPRNCIGRHFAEGEAKIILSNLIRKFHFSLDHSTAQSGVSFTIFIAMKSKHPIKLKIAQRK
jgi:cytochrome P450